MTGVPFMLTNAMKDALRSRGLTDVEIEQITPTEAQKILLTPDPRAVREFIQAIATQAKAALGAGVNPGLLQLTRLHPISENLVPSRFELDDIERMVNTAIGDCEAGHNVYIEGRTVPTNLCGSERGKLLDTVAVFALVIDSDADKDMGWTPPATIRPSMTVETSPGNFQFWFFLRAAITAELARKLGERIRRAVNSDNDTGNPTQPYRVAGTVNYPSAAKIARGRDTVWTRLIALDPKMLWTPEEIEQAFPLQEQPKTNGGAPASAGNASEADVPVDTMKVIRDGPTKGNARDRSLAFFNVMIALKRLGFTVEGILELLERHPEGIAKKYEGRLQQEVERAYNKIDIADAAGQPQTAAAPASTSTPMAVSAPQPQLHPAQAQPQAQTQPAGKPTIKVVAGELPRMLKETEDALLASRLPIFSRAGALVLPVSEVVSATDGRKTRIARLRAFCVESLMEWAAEAAIFQRRKRGTWVDIDPPHQLIRMLLVREGRWNHPPIKSVITTPTLRPDGSLLVAPGYDPQTELYLLPGGLHLPSIPTQPNKKEARKALESLRDLFSEFSFVGPLDRAVALSGLLTVLVRGSLSVAPLHLIRAHASGTGKSYLADVVAGIAIGDICPAITMGKNKEEVEKRLGAIILSGDQLVSLDNCTDDLDDPLLCQLVERPVVKVRVLGQSQMPRCECRTAVFATGNNITVKGDMVRRGAICNLDALSERPEQRTFKRNTLGLAIEQRASYVAAALTVIRGYLAAGAPNVCGPIASYAAWSRLVRSPLIWLGENDPVKSMDEAHAEDPERNDMREFAHLWLDSDLKLEYDYETARIIEIACAPPIGFNPSPFKEFLLRVAANKKDGTIVSPERLGWWLRRISGQVIGIGSDEYRVVMSPATRGRTRFRLSKTS